MAFYLYCCTKRNVKNFPHKSEEEIKLLRDHYASETNGEVEFHVQCLSPAFVNLSPHKEKLSAPIG